MVNRDGLEYAQFQEGDWSLPGFTLNQSASSEAMNGKVLKSDGSTVLQVKSDRKQVEIYVNDTFTLTGLFGAPISAEDWKKAGAGTFYFTMADTTPIPDDQQTLITVLVEYSAPDPLYYNAEKIYLKCVVSQNKPIYVRLNPDGNNNKVPQNSNDSNMDLYTPVGDALYIPPQFIGEMELVAFNVTSGSIMGDKKLTFNIDGTWLLYTYQQYHDVLVKNGKADKANAFLYGARKLRWNIQNMVLTPNGIETYGDMITVVDTDGRYKTGGITANDVNSKNSTPIDTDLYQVEGYYKDRNCVVEFFSNNSSVIPTEGQTVYVKLTPKITTVEFLLYEPGENDGTRHFQPSASSVPDNDNGVSAIAGNFYHLNVYKGYSLDGIISNDDGLLDTYIPKNDNDRKVFRYWYYKNDSGTSIRYYPSQLIHNTLTLYPYFEDLPEVPKRPVHVYFLKEGVKPETAAASDHIAPMQRYPDCECGIAKTFGAVNVSEYYSLGSIIREIIPFPEEGETTDTPYNVVFYYRPVTTWHYTVEYCVRYSSYLTPAGGTLAGYTIAPTDEYLSFPVGTVQVKESYYMSETVGYQTLAGFENYRLHHIEYENPDNAVVSVVNGDDLCVIFPGKTKYVQQVNGKDIYAKVRFYLEPDTASLTIENRTQIYNGDPAQASKQVNNVFAVPSGCTMQMICGYRFFDANGTVCDPIDAGVYTMEGNVILAVTPKDGSVGTQYYMIWQDKKKNASLRIDLRPFTIISASAEQTASDKPLVKSNFIMPGKSVAIPASADKFTGVLADLKAKFPEITNYAGQSAWYAGDGTSVNGDILLIGPNDGKAPIVHHSGDIGTEKDGINVLFSVEAFRQGVGSADNAYTYLLKDNTTNHVSDYQITTVFGTLTVKPETK